MAAFEIPRPRSKQQTLGEMLNVFTSRYGIPRLKVGGPLLTQFESVAQSQMRCTQDIWNLLDLSDFNRLEGSALDFRVAEEGIAPRFGARPTTGRVNFTDPRFNRIATRIYSGSAPPSAGAVVITVADASGFPGTGSLYIGRGTVNAEGPLAYTSITPVGQAYQIALSSPTTKFHNLNEDVVLSQGGNRAIPVGTTVSTAKDGRSAPLAYTTTQLATILDGEVLVSDVPVICQTPGTAGNVPRGAVSVVTSSPFPQAAVSNSIDFTNGTDIEQDADLRERLRAARASRSRGTATSILYGVKGLFSSEDQKRVLSASLVQPAGEPATLYIDDGTGYEETNAGTAYEVLADSASGGEREFAISGRRPIAKAFIVSSLSAPFALTDGAVLRMKVGGIVADHSFSADEFTSIAAANAYEVVSSINGNPDIPFSARTAENGTKFAIFAREDSSEDVQCLQPDDGDIDANDVFGFSTTLTYTMKLYKNDVLLYKDGRPAVLNSEPQTTWGVMSTGVELRLAVDGTPAVTYVFTDADFVNAGTGYTTLSHLNSLESWAAVINAKIPGVTADDGGGFLTLTSNLGPSGRAALTISSTGNPNMVSAGVFTSSKGLTTVGLNKDYTVNRQTGDIKLTKALGTGDMLTIGSFNTRAAVVSAAHLTSAVTLGATARVWACIDGTASAVATTVDGSTTYSVTNGTVNRKTYAASTVGAFSNVLPGDFAIIWDPALQAHGCFRICEVPTTSSFVVEHPAGDNQAGVTLTQGGFKIFRCTTPPVCLRFIVGTNRSLSSLVTEGQPQLVNATLEVFKSTKLRLRSNSYENGAVTVLTADAEGQKLLFPLASQNSGSEPHIGNMRSGNPEVGTPVLSNPMPPAADIGGDLSSYALSAGAALDPSWMVYITRKRAGSTQLYGNAVDRHFTLGDGTFNSTFYTNFRKPPPNGQLLVNPNVVRNANVVTVGCPTNHSLAVGDVIWMDYAPGATPDANFARGLKVVSAIGSATSFSYAETGANATCTATMTFNIWDGTIGFQAVAGDSDWFNFMRPYAIGAYDNLNVTLNKDAVNQAYDVPLYRRGRFNVATLTAGSPLNVVDVDGGGGTFSSSFGTADPSFFKDFHVYMRARTVTHKNTANKSIVWRLTRFGPEGNNWRLRYVNPSTPAAGLSHTITRTTATASVGPKVSLDISLPSGAARTVASLEASTRWTWEVTPFAGPDYKRVVFTYAQAVSAIYTVPGTGATRASGVVTVNCTAAHGYTTGETINLVTSADANFPVGAKIITVTSATQFTYPEAGSDVNNAAQLTFSSASAAPDLSNIIVGDIVSIQQDGTNELLPLGAWRVYAVDNGAKTFTIRVPSTDTVATQTTPKKNGTISNLQFFPINTAASTATLIKAYADASMSSLVTATLVGTGATAVTNSSEDEYYQGTTNTSTNTSTASVGAWLFLAGLSWVQDSNLGVAPNTITLKLLNTTITGASDVLPDILSTDVANEEFRLVPATTACLKKWLSSPAVSGVYASAAFDYVGNDGYLQIATRNIGSGGAVAVSGGLANSISTPVLTTGENVDTFYGQVTIPTALALGLHAGQTVALENTLPTAKNLGLTSGTTVALAADGTVTVSVPVWSKATGSASLIPDNCPCTIHRVGKYTLYRLETTTINLAGADLRGRFFRFDVSEASASNRVKSARIIAHYGGNGSEQLNIWIENPNGVTERVVSADDANVVHIYSADSVQPGDTLNIGFALGNAANQGSYIVTALGATGNDFVVDKVFTVTGATALGSNLPLFQVTTDNFRLIEEVYAIVPDLTDGNRSKILLKNSATSALVGQLNPNLGASLEALDKLEFSNDIAAGTDGYSSSTGLIGETVRTLYGDPNAPTIYPGLAAVGATIYVAGPNVKRIKLSLQLRLRSGVTAETVVDRVRAAVTSEINRIPHGKPVDLSRVVKAARGVQGVFSCVILSPTYTASEDTIAVQANEKPLILDAATDISITVVGQV